ncbi:MAG: hypothetical protein AAFV54_07055, partial [Pseudomonadota bacterium]
FHRLFKERCRRVEYIEGFSWFDSSTPLLEQSVETETPLGSVLDAPVENAVPVDPPQDEQPVDNPDE